MGKVKGKTVNLIISRTSQHTTIADVLLHKISYIKKSKGGFFGNTIILLLPRIPQFFMGYP
jgi:hypothetical protein